MSPMTGLPQVRWPGPLDDWGSADGAEALEAMATTSYDAVLTDGHMPVLDGYDATREIKRWGGYGSAGTGDRDDNVSDVRRPGALTRRRDGRPCLEGVSLQTPVAVPPAGFPRPATHPVPGRGC